MALNVRNKKASSHKHELFSFHSQAQTWSIDLLLTVCTLTSF